MLRLKVPDPPAMPIVVDAVEGCKVRVLVPLTLPPKAIPSEVKITALPAH